MSRRFTVAEIAARVGGHVAGDGSGVVTALRPLDDAGPGDLTFLGNVRYRERAGTSKAAALLTTPRLDPGRGPVRVVVADPYAALAVLVPLFHPPAAWPEGVAKGASVAPGAVLAAGVSVGPLATIADGVRIGAGTRVGAGCHVGSGAVVGAGCLLHPGVILADGVLLGDRVIVQAGAVIGSDGFGYATAEGRHQKIPQVGTVRIGDDVEIGANSCVDRASLGETVIGRGTKIDNLVQIAHGVRIGEDCFIVAQAGIAGSTHVGDRTVMAGQSGSVGHVKIGSGVQVAGKSVVTGDIPDGSFVAGYPARDHRAWKRSTALVAALPRLRARLLALEQRLAALEGRPQGGDPA